jgi:hypothetical protein
MECKQTAAAYRLDQRIRLVNMAVTCRSANHDIVFELVLRARMFVSCDWGVTFRTINLCNAARQH